MEKGTSTQKNSHYKEFCKCASGLPNKTKMLLNHKAHTQHGEVLTLNLKAHTGAEPKRGEAATQGMSRDTAQAQQQQVRRCLCGAADSTEVTLLSVDPNHSPLRCFSILMLLSQRRSKADSLSQAQSHKIHF